MVFNLVFILFFAFAIYYNLNKIKHVNPYIVIKAVFLNINKLLFIIILLISIIGLFFRHAFFDVLQALVIIFACILYLLLKDGMGDNAIFIDGNVYTFKQISSYYFKYKKNYFIVFFKLVNSNNNYFGYKLKFKLKQKDDVIVFLKEKLANKKCTI